MVGRNGPHLAPKASVGSFALPGQTETGLPVFYSGSMSITSSLLSSVLVLLLNKAAADVSFPELSEFSLIRTFFIIL